MAIPECPEEKKQQSSLSPAVVEDCETLGRVVHHDHHYQDGELQPALFPIDDLRLPARGGLSVMRTDGKGFEESHETARKALAQPQTWRWHGLATARCRGVRDIKTESDRRAFCVVDDGLEDYRTHALVRWHGPDPGPAAVRRLRAKLLALFQYWPDASYFADR